MEVTDPLAQQILSLDAGYPGGLVSYVANAKLLLKSSFEGTNPLDGCVPGVPTGERLQYGDNPQLQHFERLGAAAAASTGFILVAGGLGERLGYSGIKVALPVETSTNKSFLHFYIENILEYQRRASGGALVPLAIMTSDDTHERTRLYLDANDNFGLQASQLTLMKQDKVACLADNDARIALDSENGTIMTKPHGHGDVHALMHSTGLAREWWKRGVRWLYFFQDTNALAFKTFPAALGASLANDLDVNSLCVPRKAKEAIGGIAHLKYSNGRELTLNVEYNQLDPILRATVSPEGDVNDPETGYSPFPGNINQIVFKLESYMQHISETQGAIPEFVNPKYTDATRTQFKSPTRLECMMQDYPRSLPNTAKVSFTVIEGWASYSPVKNHPAEACKKSREGTPSHGATDAENDFYGAHARSLSAVGVDVGGPVPVVLNGIKVSLFPRIRWDPGFALTFEELKKRFPNPSKVSISSGSTLILRGRDIVIESLQLDGALVVDSRKQSITIRDVKVANAGWRISPLLSDLPLEGLDEERQEILRLRGFEIIKDKTCEINS